MSKKLAAKASLIQMPPLPSAGAAAEVRPDAQEPRVKTAPGSMAHFMASQSSAVKEAEELRDRLKAFEGAHAVRQLDPRVVRASRWANRHADSFGDAAFEELKSEIASAGGNVQPASVRRLATAAVSEASGDGPVYELIFGHRRHRACLELGLPLQAMVVEASDRELFEAMERENRSRKNLSAWEQGTMYRRALDEGLYPSQRKLAEALGVDISLVSKSLSLARLPEGVVAAFGSPLDIQFRWAQPLSEALQRDPDAMLARAAQLRSAGGTPSAAQVFAVLTGQASPVLNGSTPRRRLIPGAAGLSASMARDAQGRVVIQFPAGALDAEGEAELAGFIERLLGRR
jgi:ParB family transcriptional regulator, chromosome partitioning protein